MPTEIKYNKDGTIAKKRGRKPKNTVVENPVPTTGTVVENLAEPEEFDETANKNHDPSEEAIMEGVIENPPEAEKRDISPKVKKNNVPVCSRCGKEIKTTPYRLNLTYLTGGIASWHRYTADDKPILCKGCATDLSSVIDKWLLKGGAETKFPAPDMVGVDVSEAEDMTDINNKFVNKKIENKEENKEEDFDF